MIRDYSVPSSVLPGETLILHISTNQPQFRVEFYRQGESLIRMEEGLDWQLGYFADKAPIVPIPHGANIEDQVWHQLLHEDPIRFARKYQLDKNNLEVILQKANHLAKLATDLMELQKKK